MSAALVLIGAAAGAPAPLYGLYQQRFGITDADLTASLAIYIVLAAIALLLFGRLPDFTNGSGSARASCRCTCISQEP